MKHLIETTDLSSLPITRYDRLILDSATNEIVCKGGGIIYEYVDLGLPSGLKWAKCNIGAETETDYGDYFMWGSTKPNTADECTWVNAPFNNGSSDYNETYFNSVKDTVCPNGVLAKEYDTASQIMGGDWRMPTEAEFNELLDKTDNKWVDNFNNSGVNGWKFTSKTDTSKYIFIPAASYCFNSNVVSGGNNGVVWSSSLHTPNPDGAWGFSFSIDREYDDIYHDVAGYQRYYGRSVRGVRK